MRREPDPQQPLYGMQLSLYTAEMHTVQLAVILRTVRPGSCEGTSSQAFAVQGSSRKVVFDLAGSDMSIQPQPYVTCEGKIFPTERKQPLYRDLKARRVAYVKLDLVSSRGAAYIHNLEYPARAILT